MIALLDAGDSVGNLELELQVLRISSKVGFNRVKIDTTDLKLANDHEQLINVVAFVV